MTYTPSVLHERADEREIVVLLESRSVAELNAADFLLKEFPDLTPPIFWFARIKATVEGIGDGTLMMQRVCHHLDSMGATAVNGINPYGKRDLQELIGFFGLFGFELGDGCEDTVIRKPNNL